jgi:hypothetical protein
MLEDTTTKRLLISTAVLLVLLLVMVSLFASPLDMALVVFATSLSFVVSLGLILWIMILR